MMGRLGSHRALAFYAGTIALVGGLALVTALALLGGDVIDQKFVWLPAVTVAIILGECFPIRLWRADGQVTVSTGFSLALLWLAGPAAVLLSQAAAVLVAEMVGRRKPRRAAFNVGQLSLAWLAAAAAMMLTGGGADEAMSTAADIGSIAAAGAAFTLVNVLLTGTAGAIAGDTSLWRVLQAFGRIEFGTVVMLTGFAPVIVVTIQTAPLLLPLLGFPLAAIHVGGAALARSEHQALHDALTGLANRTQMHRALAGMAPRGPVGVLFADLDRFKDVNDSLGHAVGDHLLRRIGRELRARLPEEALVARLAGDEFAVLLPGADLARVHAVAAQVHALLRDVPDVAGMRLEVGASIGVALAPEHGVDADLLVKRAEIAMYDAKRRRNHTAVYRDGTDEEAAERLRLVGDLRRAIADRAIDVHYQPKLDLVSGRICGVEALARWDDPERGPVPPAVFIPLAETAGLIGELGSVVLDRAVADLAAWRASGLELKLAVNLSVRRLADGGIVDEVSAVLAAHGVPAVALELEITESVFLEDPDRARGMLEDLRTLGVTLAVDDFGTGYSSLAYLRDLPISTLKLDRAFVSNVLTSYADHAIIESTTTLARTLGVAVVAEGIEDSDTLEAVERLGCTQAQGYFIGRPQPAAAITALFAEPLAA